MKNFEDDDWHQWCRSRWHAFADFGYGIFSGFPLCCVIEFTIRSGLGQQRIALDVGCMKCKAGYVHCFYHRWRLH